MKKKGDIWISAVLYIALGMVLITLVLTAGVPLVNKIQDKNAVVQSKTVMFSIDENIRAVASEGPGSRRVLSPLEIQKGELSIDAANEKITWSMPTKNQMMDPDTDFKEGNLNLNLESTALAEEYKMVLSLDYSNSIDIALAEKSLNQLIGTYALSIEHLGYSGTKPQLTLKIT